MNEKMARTSRSGQHASFVNSIASIHKVLLINDGGISPGTVATEPSTDSDASLSSPGKISLCNGISCSKTTIKQEDVNGSNCKERQQISGPIADIQAQIKSKKDRNGKSRSTRCPRNNLRGSLICSNLQSSPIPSTVSSPSSSCCGDKTVLSSNSVKNQDILSELKSAIRRGKFSSINRRHSSFIPTERSLYSNESHAMVSCHCAIGVGSVTKTSSRTSKRSTRCSRRHSIDCIVKDTAMLHRTVKTNKAGSKRAAKSCKRREMDNELVNRELILLKSEETISVETSEKLEGNAEESLKLRRSHSGSNNTFDTKISCNSNPIVLEERTRRRHSSTENEHQIHQSHQRIARRHSVGIEDVSSHFRLKTGKEQNAKLVRQSRQRKGYRHDYILGDLAHSSSHMVIESEEDIACWLVGSLREYDFAFVKRVDGWTYSILVYRSSEAQTAFLKDSQIKIKADEVEAEKDSEEFMLFVVSKDGKTKMLRKRHWGKYIRLVSKRM